VPHAGPARREAPSEKLIRASGSMDTRGMSLSRTSPRAAAWTPGWAVRRDWPDGCHQFVRFEVSEESARAFVRGDARYWRRGPIRPKHSVVVISARDFELHRRRDPCRAPDCPQQAPRGTVLAGSGSPVPDGGVR
jgi:hypothetical protein